VNVKGDEKKGISSAAPVSPSATPRTSTSPVRTRRNPHRDLSSSIASNLARQRRGLPATPELNTQQVGGKILSQLDRPGYSSRQLSPERTRKSLKPVANEEPSVPTPATTRRTTDDQSFNTFYNTFENLFSKLSAPLAFAGLPLTAEQAIAESAQAAAKKEKTRAPASDDPDLTKIYSNATLRSIGPAFGPQESFYLVPPTGGTESYAGILTSRRSAGHDGRNAAHVPETIEEDADEFVDARESLGPPSPRSLRSSRKGGSPSASRDGGRKGFGMVTGAKTMEELELENNALKQLLDTQAKRLQMWEMSSQSQSMALQQSIRAARPPPSLPATISDPATLERIAASENERVKELEELLKAERVEKESLEHQNEKIARENEKLHGTIGRYRDKWESLKAGARKRESEKKGGSAGGPPPRKGSEPVDGDIAEES
jgi:hypothetical protein